MSDIGPLPPPDADFDWDEWKLGDPNPPLPLRRCNRHRTKTFIAGPLRITWATQDVCVLEKGHTGSHVVGWPRRGSYRWPPR